MNNYEHKHSYLSECPRCGECGIEHLISYSHCLNCGYSYYGSHDKCIEHSYFEAMELEKELDELLLEEALKMKRVSNTKALLNVSRAMGHITYILLGGDEQSHFNNQRLQQVTQLQPWGNFY